MENKTSKYFKYAIGEIILVVLGILIALSINNWNENRQNKKNLTIYTNQLLEEINLNIKHLNGIIETETELLKHLDTVVDIISNKEFGNPKLLRKSFALLTFEDFNPESIAYENLKSSGEFKLIESIELRNAISNAYNTFEEVELTEEVHHYNMKTRIADYFMENADYGDFTKSSATFGQDRIFKNLTFGSVATFNQKINSCKNSLEAMEDLKEKLITFQSEEL